MNNDKIIKRLEHLKKEHKKFHLLIEALEGEKAPEEILKNHKKIKLAIKDEIASIETTLQGTLT
jgi:hypothetical protein